MGTISVSCYPKISLTFLLALCVRQDRSEQSVCPRKCLSSRPVTPSQIIVFQPSPVTFDVQESVIKSQGTLFASSDAPGIRLPKALRDRKILEASLQTEQFTAQQSEEISKQWHDALPSIIKCYHTDISTIKIYRAIVKDHKKFSSVISFNSFERKLLAEGYPIEPTKREQR